MSEAAFLNMAGKKLPSPCRINRSRSGSYNRIDALSKGELEWVDSNLEDERRELRGV
jgi:hypothetical protein